MFVAMTASNSSTGAPRRGAPRWGHPTLDSRVVEQPVYTPERFDGPGGLAGDLLADLDIGHVDLGDAVEGLETGLVDADRTTRAPC